LLLRRRPIIPIISLVLFLAIWQLIGSNMSPILFATPVAVVKALINLARTGQLLGAFGQAMADFSVGFAGALIVGTVVGTLMGQSVIVDRALSPYINFLQAMPSVAALPLLVVWTGVGYEARISFTFWLALLPILIATHAGTAATPGSLRDLSKIYKLGRFTVLRRITIPYAMPFIFTGLRRGIGLGLIGMLLGEMDISVSGLGGLVINYGDELKTAYLLAAICLAAFVGVIAVGILQIIRRQTCPWIDALTNREGQ
jgi:NitT/TauT family transport system permease protein